MVPATAPHTRQPAFCQENWFDKQGDCSPLRGERKTGRQVRGNGHEIRRLVCATIELPVIVSASRSSVWWPQMRLSQAACGLVAGSMRQGGQPFYIRLLLCIPLSSTFSRLICTYDSGYDERLHLVPWKHGYSFYSRATRRQTR